MIFGFTVSGLVQSFLPRDGLRHQLGEDTPSGAPKASQLGAISSSCSYAASAMARALFARGASWSNAMIGMVVVDDGLHAQGPDGVTYYFCGEACRSTFFTNRAAQASQRRSGEVIP